MRKVVTPFVFLSLFLALWSCTGQPSSDDGVVIKKSKPAKIRKSAASSDTLLSQDTSYIDTLFAETDSLDIESLDEENTLYDADYSSDEDSVLVVAKRDTVDFYQYDDSVAISDNDIELDSDDSPMDDSHMDQQNLPDRGLNLNKERLVKTEILTVYRPDFVTEYDSTLSVIEKRIALNPDQVSTKMVVERWVSPVNYRGYKFNRKKLMLYGVDKNEVVHLYYYLDGYYFSMRNRIYSLKETNNNTSFMLVKDSVLEKNLLEYEDQL